MTEFPIVTAVAAGLSGLLIVLLALRVVFLRRRYRIGIGADGAPELNRAVRVHGNALENLPISLILLLIAELAGVLSTTLLAVVAAVIVIARLLHAWGLSHSEGASNGRFIGTLANWLAILLLSGMLIGIALSQLVNG